MVHKYDNYDLNLDLKFNLIFPIFWKYELNVWFLDLFREALYAGHSFSAANKRAQTPRSQAQATGNAHMRTISLFFLLSLSLLQLYLQYFDKAKF